MTTSLTAHHSANVIWMIVLLVEPLECCILAGIRSTVRDPACLKEVGWIEHFVASIARRGGLIGIRGMAFILWQQMQITRQSMQPCVHMHAWLKPHLASIYILPVNLGDYLTSRLLSDAIILYKSNS